MHIIKEQVSSAYNLRPSEFFLAPSMVKYFNSHGRVGARDLGTLELLRKAGVESYFSGCLTLTLERPNITRNPDLIVLNDLPPNKADHLPYREALIHRVEQFVAQNASYVWQPNPLHPTAEDRQEALRHISAAKAGVAPQPA
jgi:hypothetical protein